MMLKAEIKIQSKKTTTVLKNASMLYYELINMYIKKDMTRFLELKMKTGGKNMTIKI